MPNVVLDERGRAVIFDRVTGEVRTCSVPTALENVERGAGRYVHGATGVRADAPPPEPVVDEPVILLREEDVLDLPAEDQPAPEPTFGPLDRDHDGNDGGSLPGPRPRPRPRPRAKK